LASILFQSAVAHGHPPPDVTAEILSQALSSTSAVVIDCSSGTTCTFDVDIDGTTDFTMSTTGLTIPRTSNPCYTFGDSDTTDSDANAQICVQCTDTGSGTEDCDLTISQQIAGTMTDVWELDADGPGSNFVSLGQWTSISVPSSVSALNMRVGQAGARGPTMVPRAGKVRAITCQILASSSDPLTAPTTGDTCTSPCFTVELYVDEADAAVTDCVMNTGVGTCTVTGIAKVFSAGSRIQPVYSTAADLSSTARTLLCHLWGTFD